VNITVKNIPASIDRVMKDGFSALAGKAGLKRFPSKWDPDNADTGAK
jgi:hypothetical protein